MSGKGTLTNRPGFEKFAGTTSGYQNSYGVHLRGLLKPFTTHTLSTGVPHYQEPVWVSGGATSSGLNPFGENTQFEGHIHGSGMPTDIGQSINSTGIRSAGFKNPLQIVGWGYDPWGYPSPNADANWEASGIFNEGTPSGEFISTTGTTVSHGKDVPVGLYNAGPLDLRYDPNRKVWTSNASVFSARVSRVTINGGGLSTEPQFPEDVTYDVEMAAGPGDYITITGVIPISPRPDDTTFKIRPRPTGSYCMIMHTIISGKPNYGAWLGELYGVEECDTGGTAQALTSTGVSFTSGVTSDQLVAGDSQDGSLKNSLLNTGSFPSGLSQRYGGTNHTNYGSGDILIGNSGGTLGKFNLLSGSGIELEVSGFANDSGTLTIKFASGVDFVNTSGANTSITELQGLTTPLTIAQGGTGASGQIFVDTTGANSVSGTKTFTNPVFFASGTVNGPGIIFNNSPSNYGLFMKTNTGAEALGFSVSGTQAALMSTTGILFSRQGIRINPSVAVTGETLLSVGYNTVSGFQPEKIQSWNQDGIDLTFINHSGHIHATELYVSGENPVITETNRTYPSGVGNRTELGDRWIDDSVIYRQVGFLDASDAGTFLNTDGSKLGNYTNFSRPISFKAFVYNTKGDFDLIQLPWSSGSNTVNVRWVRTGTSGHFVSHVVGTATGYFNEFSQLMIELRHT